MEQLTKNQAVATSQEAVQNQNEPQLRDENAHNDKSVHGVRSEERRVGKECRSPWTMDDKKYTAVWSPMRPRCVARSSVLDTLPITTACNNCSRSARSR